MALLCHSVDLASRSDSSAVPGGLDQCRPRLEYLERNEGLPRDGDGDRADAWVATGEDLEAAGDSILDRGRAHGVDRAGAVAPGADRVEDDARGLARVGRIQFDRPVAELRFQFADQLLALTGEVLRHLA